VSDSEIHPLIINYHQDPQFALFNTSWIITTENRTIELHGEHLHSELPYRISLINGVKGTNREEILCVVDSVVDNVLNCTVEIDEEHMRKIEGINLTLEVEIGANLNFK